MLEIDGSMGEGGGQILRSAVALSALTGKECRIENIRINRPRPGLAPQHLAGVRSVGSICDARLEGAEKGSTSLTFSPGKIRGGDHQLDVGTAGSITLVLQACLLPVIGSGEPLTMRIRGGTNVRWSPPVDYYSLIFLPLLRKMGVDVSLEITARGFYPEGGGEVRVSVPPTMGISPLVLPQRGRLLSVQGVCFSHNLPEHVCERIARSAVKEMPSGAAAHVINERGSGPSTGAGICLCAQFENTWIGADALGERGMASEEVGKMAARNLIKELEGGGTLDMHAADQLIPYLALAEGPSRFLVKEMTGHLRTQMDLLPLFLKVEFEVKESERPIEISVWPSHT